MRMDFITFRSITPAQRGERIVQKEGIGCVLTRTPRHLAAQGCGYSLRLRQGDTPRAVAALRKHGIPYSRVFTEDPNGNMEERSL